MVRSFLLLAFVGLAAPAAASSYFGNPQTPAPGQIIARDIVWNCGAAGCQGATEESRPLVLCQSLARQAGKLSSFIVDGRPFTPAELDKCNSFAKPQRAAAITQR